ncbi:hypothetical protein D3C74_189050 [compost metagenome]
MQSVNSNKSVKMSFWGAWLFYFLIAFEFFYMASPFAVYFYSIYEPALQFFNQSPLLSWLISFFLPHAVRETTSALINLHTIVGAILTLVGFLGFILGAIHIYYYKLAKKGIVTGGIYNYIRHPQYSSFIICSFGLLILWPRYIVLIMFITMLFVYYLLARAEERECVTKFGASYIEYRSKTGMFLPFRIFSGKTFSSWATTKTRKWIFLLCAYMMTIVLAIGIANVIQRLTINSLYAVYSTNSATISISKIKTDTLNQIIQIALSDETVQSKVVQNNNDRYLNYVLPTTWFAAEIPMNGVKYREGHKSPREYDRNSYKIIFTKAVMRSSQNKEGKAIISNVSEREGIVEVWINLAEQKVDKVVDLPKSTIYANIPVALY